MNRIREQVELWVCQNPGWLEALFLFGVLLVIGIAGGAL